MELYSIYQIISLFFGKLVQGDDGKPIAVVWDIQGLSLALIVSASLCLVLFVLQAIGLCKMAKNRGIKGRWRAFIPFVNTYFIGKLAGECSVFRHRMKRAGLYVMLVQIAVFAVCAMDVAAQFILFSPKYIENLNVTKDAFFWSGLSGKMVYVEAFYRSSELFISLLSFAYQILTLILVMALYKKYNPRSFRILAIVSALQPLARYICIFVLRNRQAIDYEAYVRARQEEFFRRQQEQYRQYQQQYGNNPYGNPFGGPFAGPFGPYGNPYQNANNGQNTQHGTQSDGQKRPEEPFGEFSGGNSGGDNSSGDNSSGGTGGSNGGDGLFD